MFTTLTEAVITIHAVIYVYLRMLYQRIFKQISALASVELV